MVERTSSAITVQAEYKNSSNEIYLNEIKIKKIKSQKMKIN